MYLSIYLYIYIHIYICIYMFVLVCVGFVPLNLHPGPPKYLNNGPGGLHFGIKDTVVATLSFPGKG